MALLIAIIEAGDDSSVADIAQRQGLALSTAKRMVAQMEASGLLLQTGRGRRGPGFGLLRLAARVDHREILRRVARPVLRKLAVETGRTTHLGVFEAEMVTYLVKEAPRASGLFTRETMQLEAYCSGIGKVLLSELPTDEREAYLATGPFVSLTPRTLVDPDLLRIHLAQVAKLGYAVDDEEVAEGLFCMAAPVAVPTGAPPVAISVAGARPTAGRRDRILERLQEASGVLADRLAGRYERKLAASETSSEART
jgi:DNA-binding IclR family transcriptional regulator